MWAEAGAITTALAYAASNVLVRVGLTGSTALTGAIVTLTVNNIILMGLSFALVPWEAFRISSLWIFLLDGVLTQAFGRLLKFVSIERLGAARAAAIMGSTPMFSISLAVLLIGEKLTPLLFTGVVAIVLGIILTSEQEGPAGGRLKDIIFPLAASLLFGFSPVLRKWGLGGIDYPILGAATTSSTSLLMLLTVSRIFEKGGSLKVSSRSLKYFFLSGLCTAVALPTYYYSLRIGDVVVVGPLNNTGGFFTVVIAQIFLAKAENITWRVWAGCLAVVAGAVAIIVG